MNENLAQTLVRHEFDEVMVSYHAASEEGNSWLMTGRVDKIDRNLKTLAAEREKAGASKPEIVFNFALQRMNAEESFGILDKAKSIGADAVIINRYYGGRNRLQDRQVSYEYDVDEGNQQLDRIYAHGKELGVPLRPATPSYWTPQPTAVIWDPDDWDSEITCRFPWIDLHFNPVLDQTDAHYVGVCNRIELMRVEYREGRFDSPEGADALWNHPVLQYLRETVNAGDRTNPVCQYCKNRRRATLRNVDAETYAAVRDEAVAAFFEGYRKQCDEPDIAGVTVLDANPNSDAAYSDRLDAMKADEVDMNDRQRARVEPEPEAVAPGHPV